MRSALTIIMAIGFIITVIGCKKKDHPVIAPVPPPVSDITGAIYIGPDTGPAVSMEAATNAPPPAVDTGGTYAPPTPAGTVAPAPGAPAGSSVHLVKRGDTLWSIAQRYYGDGRRWGDIARANGLTNPKKLAVGQRLTLP